MTVLTRDETLPSLGRLYGDKVPGGAVTIRMMNTQDEKNLSGNQGNPERAVSKLLDSVIQSPAGIFSANLLSTDRIFLLIKLRALTFLPQYNYKIVCPNKDCKKVNSFVQNLDELPIDYLPEDFVEPFQVNLPVSGDTLMLRLPRGIDEENVPRESKRLLDKGSDGDNSYIVRLAMFIDSINDEKPETFIMRLAYAQKLYAMDAAVVRTAIDDVKFGVDLNIYTECKACGTDIESILPMGDEFFRPRVKSVSR